MNKVMATGRPTSDPEIRYTQGEKPVCIAQFTLAIDRKFKKKDEPTADFPRVKAFGKTAEVIEKYVKKGTKIGIVGSIQTGSYTDKNGNKVYTTDIIADEMEFLESKSASQESAKAESDGDGFMSVPTGGDDFLPFA